MIRRVDGIALPITMMTIVLIGVLSAAMASIALQLNDTSSRDRDAKRALAAAEAGMNTALERLNTLLPLDSQCLGDGPIAAEASARTVVLRGYGSVQLAAGQCAPSSVERTGNGGSFYYFVSPALSASANGCNDAVGIGAGTSRAAVRASGVTLLQRCITSVGLVAGEVRRVQRRAYSTLRLFNGATVTDTGNGAFQASNGAALLSTSIGSMGQVSMTSNVTYAGQVTRHRLAPEAEIQATGAWSVTSQEAPFILNPVNPEGIATTGTATCTLLCSAIDSNGVLQVPTGRTVTLGGGNHHVCGVNVTGGTLLVTGTASVFVDHPGREPTGAGDNCPGGSGQISITGGLVNSPTGLLASNVAPDLRFYVAGVEGSSDASAVRIAGSSVLNLYNGLFYAPRGTITVEGQLSNPANAPVVTGALSAQRINIRHGADFAGLVNLAPVLDPQNLLAIYEPGDWVECERAFPNGIPHGNCRS